MKSSRTRGWVGGLLLGYAATGAGWWIANNVLDSGTPGWALIWAITASGSWVWWARTRARPALAPLPVWTRRHTAALLLTLCLVPAIVGRPFANIGRVEGDGAHRYRAYFTADFVWHMAVVEELSKPTRSPSRCAPIPTGWAFGPATCCSRFFRRSSPGATSAF